VAAAEIFAEQMLEVLAVMYHKIDLLGLQR